MRLTEGMYGSEFGFEPGLFGLRKGQIRAAEIGHNVGWYNVNGEKLGWGDLSGSDFRTIQAELEPDEAFFVLGEQDSFWKFVTNIGPIGSMCSSTPDEKHPGREYVFAHARYVITPRGIYRVCRPKYPHEPTTEYAGLTFTNINRDEIEGIL